MTMDIVQKPEVPNCPPTRQKYYHKYIFDGR